jgi:hypothetical protein
MGKKKKKSTTDSITQIDKKWIQEEVKRLNSENSFRLKQTVDPHSNFINISQGYFNKGKHKGTPVSNVPLNYLKWVMENIELNKGETNLINKLINKK